MATHKTVSARSALQSLLRDFTTAAEGLFSASTPAKFIEYDGALYICIFVRASKAIATALQIDRELAVILTNFEDQQQRTIKVLHRTIRETDGRLEPTLAIVVHGDRRGNAKLRNWGRDVGLTVLPIHGGAKLPAGDELKRSLCFELYSHDLFDVTGPVSDDSRFYGRRAEAQNIARTLQNGEICACLGIRKVGKTSLINRIVDEVRKSHDCVSVMVDCSRDEVWQMNASQLMSSLAATVADTVTKSEEYAALRSAKASQPTALAASSLQVAVVSAKKPVVIFVDEVDYITPGSPTATHWRSEFNVFWRSLRTVYQEIARADARMSLLVGGVSSHWFTEESIEGVENAAVHFIPETYLSPLQRGATVQMLQRLGKQAGLYFDDASADAIAQAGADIPYWTRKACSYIHRKTSVEGRPVVVGAARVEELIREFIRAEGGAIAQVALAHLFRVNPRLEVVAERVSRGDFESLPERLVRALVQYGVVSAGGRALSGAMMAEGVRLHLSRDHSDMHSVSVATLESAPSGSLHEWAEELAVIGRRRNILERNLREIVLNFVRADAVAKKKIPEIAARLLAALPEKERDKASHMSAKDVLEKRFMWKNLVDLIQREWGLFESIFGDKKTFADSCGHINDRPDAHAKAIDAADLALYRRSLDWVEAAVARLQ